MSESYSGFILVFRNDLKLVFLLRVCVSESFSCVIIVIMNILKEGDIVLLFFV
jgi:hypothetical protein